MNFKEGARIETDNFLSDLIGGYINPSEILESEDAKKVEEAVKIIKKFQSETERKGIIEYF